MIHSYSITGMTCLKCVKSVKDALESIDGIISAEVTLEPPRAVINMAKHVDTAEMNSILTEHGKYSIIESGDIASHGINTKETSNEDIDRSFFASYKPVLLVFAFLIGLTALNELHKGSFSSMNAMNTFMGGFFIIFSFFKMLDLRGFAYSYMSYDIIARRWLVWGYIYAFIELSLGLAYLFHFEPFITNITTLVVMSLSSIGVIQSLAAKKKIQCACLGTVFNLPMSNITLIEDLLMVLMAAAMLIIL